MKLKCKWRVVKIFRNHKFLYFPQKRFLWFFKNCYNSENELQVYDTLQEARDYIDRRRKGEYVEPISEVVWEE